MGKKNKKRKLKLRQQKKKANKEVARKKIRQKENYKFLISALKDNKEAKSKQLEYEKEMKNAKGRKSVLPNTSKTAPEEQKGTS